MRQKQILETAATPSAGNTKRRYLLRQLGRLMPLFQALQRGNHLVAAGQLCPTCVGAKLALTAKPHDYHACEYAQHHLRYDRGNPEGRTLITFGLEHNTVHEMADDSRQKDHKGIDYPLNQGKRDHIPVRHMTHLMPQYPFDFVLAHVLEQAGAYCHQRTI